MDIFILAGQSNMAGRGGVERGVSGLTYFKRSLDPPTHCHTGALLSYSSQHGWQPANEPIHQYIDVRKTCGYGPGPFFGEELLTRKLSKAIGLIPCAVGGTDIDEWHPNGRLFIQMVEQTRAALQSAEAARLRCLLWYQGESDCARQEQAQQWPSKFTSFVSAVRAHLSDVSGLSSLPIIMVIVSCQSEKAPLCGLLRQLQQSLSLEYVYKTDAAGLELQKDGMHLTTDAQQRLGKQLADTYEEILSSKFA